MKIALICPNYPPSATEGGVSHYTQKLAQSLSGLGNTIYIVTGEEYLGSGSDGNITVFRFPGKWKRQSVREMALKLKSMSIETINLQYTPSMYPESFKFAWRYLAKRFVSTISFHTLWGGRKLNHLFALSLLQTSDGIIATNSEVKYLLKKYFRNLLKKVQFIPIGPNIELVKESICTENLLKKYQFRPERNVIAYFGMAYQGKGLSSLLEVMELLIKSHGLDVQLVIIGGGLSDSEKYISERKDLAKKLGIGERIIWTGKIDESEVSDLLSRSDLVVLPFSNGVSDRRGSLLTVLAHKKAVITTKPKMAIPLFKNRVNMLWPDKSRPKEFAILINQVLTDSQLKMKLESGAVDLMQNYRWDEIGMRTHNFMKKVIAQRL